jgi:hypothetical protein
MGNVVIDMSMSLDGYEDDPLVVEFGGGLLIDHTVRL